MSEVTDPKVAFVFDVIAKAKVRLVDFSRITGISREAFYRWKRGGNITDLLRLNRAYNYALQLEKAYTVGWLPLTDKLKKDQRAEVLKRMILTMARKK